MMHVIVFSLVLLLVESQAVYEDLVCHFWTPEDYAAMGSSRTVEIERQRCEDVLGYTFTQGKNENYPSCEGCWCCKPKEYEDLVCHLWTPEDYAAMGSSRTVEIERQRCEEVLGYTFTQGKNENYPNCKGCWCCKPKDLVCYLWTPEDYAAMGSPRTVEIERQRCEDVLGYTFTQGKNENHPKCGGCWCCQPES